MNKIIEVPVEQFDEPFKRPPGVTRRIFDVRVNAEEAAKYKAELYEVSEILTRGGAFEYAVVRLSARERDLLAGYRHLKRGALSMDDKTAVDYTKGPGIAAHTARHVAISNATDRLAAVLDTPEWRGSEVRSEIERGETVHYLKHSSGARMKLLAGVSRPCEG